MIHFQQVSKSFDHGNTFVLKNINLKISEHETLVILGPSGSGKSTLLRMINGLETPTQGTLTLDDNPIAQMDPIFLRRQMGYVIQHFGLFPHMTLLENVGLALRAQGLSKQIQLSRAKEMLAFVKLDPNQFGHRYPQSLSGGQQQRVAVARALVHQPRLLLMDEPFGALDAVTRDALQEDFLALKATLAVTVIIVTHDIMEALRLGHRILVVHRGQIEQIDTAEALLNHPKTPFVEKLLSKPARQFQRFSAIQSG